MLKILFTSLMSNQVYIVQKMKGLIKILIILINKKENKILKEFKTTEQITDQMF